MKPAIAIVEAAIAAARDETSRLTTASHLCHGRAQGTECTRCAARAQQSVAVEIALGELRAQLVAEYRLIEQPLEEVAA